MKIINIGIIGPRPYSLGGHDWNNPIRLRLISLYEEIILSYRTSKTKPVGLTGLSLGVEQDFARACINTKTNYICYLPYEEQEKNWFGTNNEYYDMLEHAEDTELLNRGLYSPRKMLTKQKFIINNSDILICVLNKFTNKKEIVKHILEKPVYVIQP